MFRIDDALDIFAVHAIGGLIGNLLTGFFAADYIAHLDGFTVIQGGWLNRHWIQLAYQFTDSVTGGLYSFCGTFAIVATFNLIPGLVLRMPERNEILGVDDVEIGEFAYDYVELARELLNDPVEDEHSRSSAGPEGYTKAPEKQKIHMSESMQGAIQSI